MTDKRSKIEFLDGLFGSRRAFSMEAIAQRYEATFHKPLSRRSFFYYLKVLRDSGAPLVFKQEKNDFGKETLYSYEAPFALNNRSLNELDLVKIKSALAVLQQYQELPQMQAVSDLILKMEWHLEKSQYPTKNIVFFEQKTLAKGLQWLRVIYQYVLDKMVIKMFYTPFPLDEADIQRCADNKGVIIFHPYFLKEYKNLWYVFGLNHHTQQVENYALDRIAQIEWMPNMFYRENVFIDSQTYFNDIVGVTKWSNFPAELFTLRVNPIIAPYWKNRPLHDSQVVLEDTPQYTTFRFNLRWNYEWQNLIVSYGAHISVLEPLWFKENISTIHQKAAALHL